MKPLQTTNELIQFAELKLAKEHKSIARAFHTGIVENLGAFRHVAGSHGWILRITSKFKNTYYVAIVVRYLYYRVVVLNDVPWKYWEGDIAKNTMYKGDNPILYKELRDAKNKSNKTTI